MNPGCKVGLYVEVGTKCVEALRAASHARHNRCCAYPPSWMVGPLAIVVMLLGSSFASCIPLWEEAWAALLCLLR